MTRRTSRAMLRVMLAGLSCAVAVAVAACGSSATTHSTPAPSRTTVTRTVTGSASSASASASSGSGSATSSSSATASTSTATSSAASAAGAPECVASGLALRSLGGSGATGHLLLGFGLRNTSGHACRTGGYPGVAFLDAAGAPLPTVPDHTTDDFFGHTVLRELTLAPGQLASFRLGVTDVSSGGSSSGCLNARGLQVIPPNDTATLRVRRDIFECAGRVSVSPLQAGTAALR